MREAPKTTHLLRCPQNPDLHVPSKVRSGRNFSGRLASGQFLELPINVGDFFSDAEIRNLKNSKSLLLVSGGPDSVFLFHLFLTLKELHGIPFDVVHFNHHLRGIESDREEFFVKELCQRHSVYFHVCHLQFEKKSRIQELARKKRYEFCHKLQNEFSYTHFVTAHHRDDVLETLLMRRSRGAGLRGFTGIRRVQWVENTENPRNKSCLYRPLVSVSKKFILTHLKKQKLGYCVDSSNLKPDYFRNRVRHEWLASWKNEDEKNEVFLASQALQSVDDYFTMRVKFLSETYSSHVPLSVWQRWPEEIQFRFFSQKLKQHGFLHQVERRHFKLFAKDRVRLELNQVLCIKNQSSVRFLTNSQN